MEFLIREEENAPKRSFSGNFSNYTPPATINAPKRSFSSVVLNSGDKNENRYGSSSAEIEKISDGLIEAGKRRSSRKKNRSRKSQEASRYLDYEDGRRKQ